MIRHILQVCALAWVRRFFRSAADPSPAAASDTSRESDEVEIVLDEEEPPVDVPIVLRRQRLDRAFNRHGRSTPTSAQDAVAGEISETSSGAPRDASVRPRRRVIVRATEDRATVIVQAVGGRDP